MIVLVKISAFQQADHLRQQPLAAPTVLPPELLDKLPETDEDWLRLLQGQAAQHHKVAQVSQSPSQKTDAPLEIILTNVLCLVFYLTISYNVTHTLLSIFFSSLLWRQNLLSIRRISVEQPPVYAGWPLYG